MGKLLVLLILLEFSATHAGVGDVYYCVTDTNLTVTSKNQTTINKTHKFKFEWQPTKIVFSGGYTEEIVQQDSANFSARNLRGSSIFHEKNNRLARTFTTLISSKGAVIVNFATCEKFQID